MDSQDLLFNSRHLTFPARYLLAKPIFPLFIAELLKKKKVLELTFVVWQRDVKVTFAKGSESPVLSAAMSPLAWYTWALSWKRCGAASRQRKEHHQLHGNCAAHSQEGMIHQLLPSRISQGELVLVLSH